MSTPALRAKLSLLDEEILAALALSPEPLTARMIASRCPAAQETHEASLRLQMLKAAQLVFPHGGIGSRMRYRVNPVYAPPPSVIARIGRREAPFGEEERPNTQRVRREILLALAAAGHAMTAVEIRPACPSGRSGHEVTQQIHILQRTGYLEGSGRGRSRLYWRTTQQMEMDLALDLPTEPIAKPEVQRVKTGWAVRLRSGGASLSTAALPGLHVWRNTVGQAIGIVIDDSFVSAP